MQFHPSNALPISWNEVTPRLPVNLPGQGFKDFSFADVSHLFGPIIPGELEFEGRVFGQLHRKREWLGWFAVMVYLLGIYWGQRWMANRQPFKLKHSLAGWNLLLALFSLVGTIRLLPYFVYVAWTNGFTYFICRASTVSYAHGPVGLWVMLFIWSKFAELLDTVFLVLRKKPVNLLHWFHHATVLLYCWYAGMFETPTGIFFALMNFAVHTVMYGYYFLAAIGTPPKWGRMVTVMQISQMVAGIVINSAHFWLGRTVPHCNCQTNVMIAATLMYGAYLALFLDFFIKRYLNSKAKAD